MTVSITPFTTTELEDMWNAAVANGSDPVFLDLRIELDEANNLGCSVD